MDIYDEFIKHHDTELGGFADIEDDIDGGYDEFVAYNVCLARDYYIAFKEENFEAIGEISEDTIDKICYWLDYNVKNDESVEQNIHEIKSGKMKTDYGRTLADAIIAKKVNYLAFWFIVNGNNNRGLYELLNQEEKKILKRVNKK